MSEEKKTLAVGDLVTWTSQAGGKSKTKTGNVFAVVPAGFHGSAYVPFGYKLKTDARQTRDHESYLIQVGKSKRLYWPLVKYLNAATFGPEPIQTEEPNNA